MLVEVKPSLIDLELPMGQQGASRATVQRERLSEKDAKAYATV